MKHYIEIAQRLPEGDPERIKRVEYFSAVDAQKAYAKAKKFWSDSGMAAVEILGSDRVITVSTNVMASVSLFINQPEDKKTKKKRK